MKKHVPIIILAIICVALAVAFQLQRRENSRMKQAISTEDPASPEPPAPTEQAHETGPSADVVEMGEAIGLQSMETAPQPDPLKEKETTKRVMREMAKTIDENPTINKMVEASQRGAIGALYADMIEYLGLNAEETGYFMDLLMYRQMANVDAHMKMASGALTEEDKKALQEHVNQINETMRSEMEQFLNDADDFEEFKYYEDTIGERMMLSQMDQSLGENTLPDDTYREVLAIMYEERENYNWATDLNDNKNRDLSPERFSQENIRQHMADVQAVGELMDKRLQELLTPEQLQAWRESGAAMQALIQGQLIQASQLYGGE